MATVHPRLLSLPTEPAPPAPPVMDLPVMTLPVVFVSWLAFDDPMATCEQLGEPELRAPFQLVNPPTAIMRDVSSGQLIEMTAAELPLLSPFVTYTFEQQQHHHQYHEQHHNNKVFVPFFDSSHQAFVPVPIPTSGTTTGINDGMFFDTNELHQAAKDYFHRWPTLPSGAPNGGGGGGGDDDGPLSVARYLADVCTLMRAPGEDGPLSSNHLAAALESKEWTLMATPIAQRDHVFRWYLATCRALRYFFLDVFATDPHHSIHVSIGVARVLTVPRALFERRVAREELLARAAEALYVHPGELLALLSENVFELASVAQVEGSCLKLLQQICNVEQLDVATVINAVRKLRVEWCIFNRMPSPNAGNAAIMRLLTGLGFFVRMDPATVFRDVANDVTTIWSLFASLSMRNVNRRANMRHTIASHETLAQEISGQQIVVLLNPGSLASDTVVDLFAERCSHVYASTAVDVLRDTGSRREPRLPVILIRACHWRTVHGLAEVVRNVLAYGENGRPLYDTSHSPHYTLVFELDPLLASTHVGRLLGVNLHQHIVNSRSYLHVVGVRAANPPSRTPHPMPRIAIAAHVAHALGWHEDPCAALLNTFTAEGRYTPQFSRHFAHTLLPALSEVADSYAPVGVLPDDSPVVLLARAAQPPTLPPSDSGDCQLMLHAGLNSLYELYFTGRLECELPTSANLLIGLGSLPEGMLSASTYILTQCTNGRLQIVVHNLGKNIEGLRKLLLSHMQIAPRVVKR